MSYQPALYLGVALAALTSFLPLAHAAEAPADTIAVQLLRNGIAGSANHVATAPEVAIQLGETPISLRKTSLADVTAGAKAGRVHRMKDGGQDIAWVCLFSPEGPEQAAMLHWFMSDEAAGSKDLVTGVATEYAPATAPEGCDALSAPVRLETGLPTLDNLQPDVDAALNGGKAGLAEPDGTSSWVFGAEPVGDGINVRSTEVKYRIENGRVIATAVRIIFEME